ncbi:MAG TPA: hypothetical protein VGJ28_03725 [Micromonosporaceae bacterium]|jgi:uncharacterized membrane protein
MEARKRPGALVLAAFANAAAAACAIAFGVDTIRQVSAFERRVYAVDPNGPETQQWINQSTAAIWLIGIGAFVVALALLIAAVLAIRHVDDTGARGRWRTVLIVTALAAIAPLYTLARGGIGFHLDAVPIIYDGDNMVILRLPADYQHSVMVLDAMMLPLLALALALLLARRTARYFSPTFAGYTVDPYAAFVRRKREDRERSAGREDHAR